MPPKPKAAAPSKKTDAKKKEKVIEDKTFGLKNKKGAKQQKFIQQVEKQVKSGGVPARKVEDKDKTKDKDAKLKEQKEMAALFKPVQKVDKGADPKTILCAFFKQGQCSKGNRCKFSHDVGVERKAEKRSIYVDMRDEDEGEGGGGLDGLGEERRAGLGTESNDLANHSNRPTTDIICKFFLDAVESNKYGWLWSCPNGDTCIYRHALPHGYILKKDKKKEDKKEEISLEELVERERAALASKSFTRITLETFLEWKKRKLRERRELRIKDEEKKRSDFKQGKHIGLSGREMFFFNPELGEGDEMEEGDEALNLYLCQDEDINSNQYKEIELEELEEVDGEADPTGTTQVSADRFNNTRDVVEPEEAEGAVAINENLFLEDELADLDLNQLDDEDLDDDDDDDDDDSNNT